MMKRCSKAVLLSSPWASLFLITNTLKLNEIHGFVTENIIGKKVVYKANTKKYKSLLKLSLDEDEDWEDEDSILMSKLGQEPTETNDDLWRCKDRKLEFGGQIILSRLVGSLGFDEIVDWEYYYNDPEEREKNVVEPNPLDPTKPKRTRVSSGCMVRLFSGEWGGKMGAFLRSQGKDYRVLIKEFVGDAAKDLAQQELDSLSRLQSSLCDSKTDERDVMELLYSLQRVPLVGVLGQLDLSEYLDDPLLDRNEWYRALKVPPPNPDSIWLIYEYAGLNTLASYSRPAPARIANLPPKRGLFGGVVQPPPPPPFPQRAKYLKYILYSSLQALAKLHDLGIAHRSIGRSSIILSTPSTDKSISSSPYTVDQSQVIVKLSDFGFSGSIEKSSYDPSFISRARAFQITNIKPNAPSLAATRFAVAEDIHALGFVFLGTLLSTLAELPNQGSEIVLPPNTTDEDSLQRLLNDIFSKDIKQFREYCMDEEVWDDLVEYLDEYSGWDLLQTMCFARERAGEMQNNFEVLTARGLLSHPFFRDFQ